MIRKSGHRFSVATNAKVRCAEIMRKQQAKVRLRFDQKQSRFGSEAIPSGSFWPELRAAALREAHFEGIP
jgi:hypothetical protein